MQGSQQRAQSFEGTVSVRVGLEYLLYLPPEYEADLARRWPVVFFLHGSGERGDDLERVKLYGLPKRIEQGQAFPFIIVSPQCQVNERWAEHVPALDGLYAEIVSRYRVDLERVYLTGLSMGGQGSWRWAVERPERFAALAPICGLSYPNKGCVLKNMPVWAFHGAKDSVVPLSNSVEMVEAIKACGGQARLTIYPEAEHDSWTETYENPALYRWLLEQSR